MINEYLLHLQEVNNIKWSVNYSSSAKQVAYIILCKKKTIILFKGILDRTNENKLINESIKK